MSDDTTAEVREIEAQLAAVTRMPDLDALRPSVVKAMKSDGTEATFKRVQSAFIKAKNRLRRIPHHSRDW